MARLPGIASRVEQIAGVTVVSTTPVAGGDICTTTRLRLTDGRVVVAKTRPRPPADFFAVEAEGLAWLREAEADGGAPVPEVIGVADDCLVLEWVEGGRPTADAAARFGRELARTHAAGAPAWGGERDGFIGLAPLPQRTAPTWPEFYATRRLLPYLKVARDRGHIEAADATDVEQVVGRLPELAGPGTTPARLHGDLWSGNVVWGADGRGHLIDPAAQGGHPETDLAMLALFGAPHVNTIIDAYHEAAPLADGWEARVPLHQLHPLLVHAVLFGGGYGARAAAAARAALDGSAER